MTKKGGPFCVGVMWRCPAPTIDAWEWRWRGYGVESGENAVARLTAQKGPGDEGRCTAGRHRHASENFRCCNE